MSIAILPMSQEFNWNSATVGLIQSSFFWGYLLTQVWFWINRIFQKYKKMVKCLEHQLSLVVRT